MSFIVNACSTHYSVISPIYRTKTTVWDFGDSGWKMSVWGMNHKHRWVELWPSIPLCHAGESWVLADDSLVFIGWAKHPMSSADRRLLVSSGASHPRDITDKVVLYALEKRIVPPQASLGQNFELDGLKWTDTGIVVVALPTRGGAGFDKPLSIPIDALIRNTH